MLNLGANLIGGIALPLIVGTFAIAWAVGVFCTSFKTSHSFDEVSGGSLKEEEEEATDSVMEKGLTLSTFSSVLSLDFDEEQQTDTGAEESGKDDDSVLETRAEAVEKKESMFSFLSSRKKSVKKEEKTKVKRSALKKIKERKKPKSDEEGEDMVEEKPSVTFAPTDAVSGLSPIKEKVESSPEQEQPASSPESEQPAEVEVHEEKAEEEDAEDQDNESNRRARLFSLSEMSAKERAHARAQSNRVFIVLFTACFVVYVWRHPLLVLLFTPFVVWSALKYTFKLAVNRYSKQISTLGARWRSFKSVIHSRKSVLFPSPIPTIVQLYLAFDKKVLGLVRSSMGGIMTSFIIVSLLILTTAVTVMLLFEIQVEVMHYVSSALTVWNNTMADSEQINELVTLWLCEERE